MTLDLFTKDPDALLDWSFDWSVWLAVDETIEESEFVIVPSGELQVSSEDVFGNSRVVWLSGGVAGNAYRVTNRVTTSSGRGADQSITIKIVED